MSKFDPNRPFQLWKVPSAGIGPSGRGASVVITHNETLHLAKSIAKQEVDPQFVDIYIIDTAADRIVWRRSSKDN